MNLETIRANAGVNYLAASNAATASSLTAPVGSTPLSTTLQAPVTKNAEYHSYQSLATVAPVPTVAPYVVQPIAPYTSQFSNGTTQGAIAPPVTSVAPAAAQSPASQASSPHAATTAAPSTDSLLASVLSSLSSGGNAAPSGNGSGVGQYSTSLPPPSAADVAALQPQAVQTSSSGPNIALIVGIIAVAGLGVYLYYRHKKAS